MTHPTPLPRILCLHGGGTSALIFRIQLRNLTRHLSPHFHFIYMDAPFPSPAGPGVLPVFADCGPYYRWMPPDTDTLADRAACAEKVRLAIKETVRKEGPGEWAGVLGFSQGGRMAAGLLADVVEGNGGGLPRWGFGVLLCASYPPYSLSAARDLEKYVRDGEGGVYERDGHGVVYTPGEEEVIGIPTVHVRGTLDPHLEKGRRAGGYFGGKRVLEFVMAHNMPGAAGDTTSKKGATEEIARAVVGVWEEVRGEGGEVNGIA